jgi:hypothetical protein
MGNNFEYLVQIQGHFLRTFLIKIGDRWPTDPYRVFNAVGFICFHSQSLQVEIHVAETVNYRNFNTFLDFISIPTQSIFVSISVIVLRTVG